jgi:hypothetical protein
VNAVQLLLLGQPPQAASWQQQKQQQNAVQLLLVTAGDDQALTVHLLHAERSHTAAHTRADIHTATSSSSSSTSSSRRCCQQRACGSHQSQMAVHVVSRVQQENAHASAVRGLQAQIVLPQSGGLQAASQAAGSAGGRHHHQQQQLAQVWTVGHDQRVCRWLLLQQAGDAEAGPLLLLQQQSSWQTEVPEPSALSVLCPDGRGAAAAAGGAFVVIGGHGLQLVAAL